MRLPRQRSGAGGLRTRRTAPAARIRARSTRHSRWPSSWSVERWRRWLPTRSADDILTLRVIDPAMGSGAFLVAACRYLSHAYERALVDEGRCAETDLDADMRANIRRTVAARCLAGVDANPVAVQLARLSLWLTTLARDKPLSFLDHRLRVRRLSHRGVPEDLWRVPSPAPRSRTRRRVLRRPVRPAGVRRGRA